MSVEYLGYIFKDLNWTKGEDPNTWHYFQFTAKIVDDASAIIISFVNDGFVDRSEYTIESVRISLEHIKIKIRSKNALTESLIVDEQRLDSGWIKTLINHHLYVLNNRT